MSLTLFEDFFAPHHSPFMGRSPFVSDGWVLKNNFDQLMPKSSNFGSLTVNEDEHGNNQISIECPGLGREEIKVSFKSGTLTISGKQSTSSSSLPNSETNNGSDNADERVTEDNNAMFGPSSVWASRSTRHFSRSLRLPDGTDPSKISAKVTNGLATITIPKPDAPVAMDIAVE